MAGAGHPVRARSIPPASVGDRTPPGPIVAADPRGVPLPAPRGPFRLATQAISHGWLQTPPFGWDPDARVLTRVERLGSGPTVLSVREHDGLALSSRNVRLGDARSEALAISRGLMEAADVYEAGCRSVPELIDAVRSHIEAVGIAPEYVTMADAATSDPMEAMAGAQVLAVAASFGGVRLIDNLTIDGDTHSVDRGTRLTRPSILYGGT